MNPMMNRRLSGMGMGMGMNMPQNPGAQLGISAGGVDPLLVPPQVQQVDPAKMAGMMQQIHPGSFPGMQGGGRAAMLAQILRQRGGPGGAVANANPTPPYPS